MFSFSFDLYILVKNGLFRFCPHQFKVLLPYPCWWGFFWINHIFMYE